ncbi:hypothetical protein EVAR_72203_1 [Eumeta japonica]|uniref:Uncharacterized protein n=1 Tax=Eumeta variegata TaxID=151549 RepID=A0A4C1SMT9_EUMVA|nr:hypothetical protein EVAR_72203_1 [Eumeta japonica]
MTALTPCCGMNRRGPSGGACALYCRRATTTASPAPLPPSTARTFMWSEGGIEDTNPPPQSDATTWRLLLDDVKHNHLRATGRDDLRLPNIEHSACFSSLRRCDETTRDKSGRDFLVMPVPTWAAVPECHVVLSSKDPTSKYLVFFSLDISMRILVPPQKVPILLHCDAFVINFTSAKCRALYSADDDCACALCRRSRVLYAKWQYLDGVRGRRAGPRAGRSRWLQESVETVESVELYDPPKGSGGSDPPCRSTGPMPASLCSSGFYLIRRKSVTTIEHVN